MRNIDREIQIQRRYYSETANRYNSMHVHNRDEHFFALSFLVASLDFLQVNSILDVGSGTGRAILYIKQRRPDLRVVGIEPVKELREIGYREGLSRSELIDGDATRIDLPEREFDLACSFGALHHIANPSVVISEMIRVSREAIFLSDSNDFGNGTILRRGMKQLLNLFGLWSLANFLKTRGRRYKITEDDGLSYSYSVFNNYSLIRKHCKSVHIFNTRDGHINPYRTASHVALLGIKK